MTLLVETPLTTQPGKGVQGFYTRYPQLGTSEVRWIAAVDFTGRIVVDAGCGDGTILEAIAQAHALQLGIGLDTSKESLAIARRRPASLSWVEGSILRMPMVPGAVDDVLSIGVVHYYQNPEPILREYARVIRPGGRVILFVYRPHPVHTLRRWLIGRMGQGLAHRVDRTALPLKRNLIMNTLVPPPYWPLSRRALHHLAGACGLEIVSIIHKPTHVPQLLLQGPVGEAPSRWRRAAAGLVDRLTRWDPLHLWSFGYYVIANRRGEPRA